MIDYQKVDTYCGKALRVSNGKIEFTAALDVGPRIIAFNKKGGGNIFYQDILDKRNKDVSSVYGQGQIWHIYGGHRVWLSPESLKTYYPDNESINYDILPKGLRLYLKNMKVINISLSLTLEFISDNSLKVTHKITNEGEKRDFCIWGLTALRSGGRMKVNLPKIDTGFLPNRNLVLWPYSDINDERLIINNDSIVINSTERVDKPLKIGTYNDDIKIFYTIDDIEFFKEYKGDKEGRYPDYFCNFETYTCDALHEVESLSPFKTLDRNEEMSFEEIWTLR
ncbi:MAG: hypothetical protein ACOYEC_04465 [Christensenellales bacterium]|jgi:hypothetical protein